jgi:nucleoside-diphosphate-sugar epimerase
VFGVDLEPNALMALLEDTSPRPNGNRFSFHDYDVHQPLRSDFLAVDALYHFAGIADPKRYLEEPITVMNLNLLGLINILERISVWSAHRPRIVYSSTSEVYGKNPRVPFREDDSDLVFGPVKNRRWCYAMTKAVGEHYLQAYSEEHDVRYTAFRFFNFVGPGIDRPGAGRVLTKMVGDALNEGVIRVTYPGTQTRCFTSSEEFVVPLLRAMTMKRDDPEAWELDHTVNLGSVIELTMLDVAGIVERTLRPLKPGVKVEMVKAEELFGKGYEDVTRRVPDISRARSLFDWKATENPSAFIPRIVMSIVEEMGSEA